MGADAGEGSATGPVQDFDLWVFSVEASIHGLDILDLEAKVVQTGLAPGSPGIDIQPNVSVSDDCGSSAARPTTARTIACQKAIRKICPVK